MYNTGIFVHRLFALFHFMKELEETGVALRQNPARAKQWLQVDTTCFSFDSGGTAVKCKALRNTITQVCDLEHVFDLLV